MFKTISCAVTGIFAVCCFYACSTAPRKEVPLVTNEQYIKGLYTRLPLDSPVAMFNYVYGQLADSVMIYPSENVYYFRTPVFGKNYDGTITLYAHERDSGIVGFGYVDRMEQKDLQKYYPFTGGSHDFTRKDGLVLKKINDHCYSCTYRDKKVIFNLYRLPEKAPANLGLADSEEWICSTFDESGVQFHLLINKKISRMFWVLNESVFVPESFHHYSKRVVIGDRTQFAFLNDSLRHRKILIGVNGESVLQNNWYDGPFDHLADNRVYEGKLDMEPYILAQYPYYKGMVDRYGRFTDHPHSGRLAIAPYRVYFSQREFDGIDSLYDHLPYADLLQLVTEQRFDIPASYYRDSL